MNLGLGLAAVDEYFKEGDRRVLREREGKRFGWEEKRAQSEMSLLGDRTEATRAGYRDTVATMDARAQRRPGETKLALAQTQSAIDRQPDEAEAAAARARTEASNAKFTETQIPTVQATTVAQNETALSNAKVNSAVAGQASDNIAQTLAIKGAQGILAKDQQTVGVLAALAKKIEAGDDAGALQFANEVAAIPNLLPGTNGMKFARVTAIPEGRDDAGNTGPGRVFETADGQRTFIADATLRNAYRASLGAPEYEFLHNKDNGAIYTGDKRTGRVQNVVPADPALARNSSRIGPLERDVNYLTTAFGMSKEDALARINSAKTKTEQQFVQDMIVAFTRTNGRQPSNEDVRSFGQLYRSSTGNAPTKSNAAGSNSAPGGNLDPQVRKLLGLPDPQN